MRKSRKKIRRTHWTIRCFKYLMLLSLASMLLVIGLFLYYGQDLPSVEVLQEFPLPQVSRVYDRNGNHVAEFFHERRTVVAEKAIPTVVKQAMVASEDAAFFEHGGLDYLGIVRALIKDIKNLRLTQGASTITQQVVKNMVLSPERSIARKIKEAILARRLEQNLSKDQILVLYLNYIPFGHGRYGIEEAAQFYFGKSTSGLNLGEAALLVGLPQSPSRLSPIRHPKRAKARQAYVLKQMVSNGYISQKQAQAEVAKPLKIEPKSPPNIGPYYIEEVRKYLVNRYGKTMVYEGGLRIHLGMDSSLQSVADSALQDGLKELDRRFGFHTPKKRLSLKDIDIGRKQWLQRTGIKGENLPVNSRTKKPTYVWDFSQISNANDIQWSKKIRKLSLQPGVSTVAPVQSVDRQKAIINLGTTFGVIPLGLLKWARKYSPIKRTKTPSKASDVLKPGQLVRVLIKNVAKSHKKEKNSSVTQPVITLQLDPVPTVQGALVTIEPVSRQVLALSGGYDFYISPFNRATQAKRQPGSCFKPFLYGAALASGKFTAATILNDAPDLFRDPWTGKTWKPRNFEVNAFEGPMSLRTALSKSKNTIAVRLIDSLQPSAVIDLARKAGIESNLPESLSLALGTGEVTPLELANSYATIASMGKRAEPIMITKVCDRTGKVLEEHQAISEETISPAVAFVLTSLMQSVIESGTGIRAARLKRPIAGKTGTTSDSRDAWFSAFTPDLVTTVWTGFDDHSSMGASITGGRGALPIWLEFMEKALKDRPKSEFSMPEGVESILIDPLSGLRAQEGTPGRMEYFVEGTAPTEYAVPPDEADPEMLFLEDQAEERF